MSSCHTATLTLLFHYLVLHQAHTGVCAGHRGGLCQGLPTAHRRPVITQCSSSAHKVTPPLLCSSYGRRMSASRFYFDSSCSAVLFICAFCPTWDPTLMLPSCAPGLALMSRTHPTSAALF